MDWYLWRRWVLANATSEFAGLGTTAIIGIGAARTFGSAPGVVAVLAMAVVMILAGTFLEGIVVGWAQWLVLRRPFPKLARRTWVRATAIGAGIAWTLGMIPSTMMSMAADAGGAPPPEMGNLTTYGLAALMGLALGPILGLPQWWVLRRHVERAGWWVPANALAWAFGMVVVFIGAGSVPAEGVSLSLIVVLIATLAAAGAVVGAIHGLALVWLLKSHRQVAR